MEVYENEELDIIAEWEWQDLTPQQLESFDWNPPYQRRFGSKKARDLGRIWDEKASGVLVLNIRTDGTRVGVDGRHRFRGGKDRQRVWHCRVFHGLTIEEEARLFRFLNTKRGNPKAIEVFHARLIERDPVALDIQTIARRHGFTIQNGNGGASRRSFATRAATALEAIYNISPLILDRTLFVIAGAWPDEGRNGEANLFYGVADVLSKHGGPRPGALAAKVIDKWTTVKIEKLLRDAKAYSEVEGGSARRAMYTALRSAYNKGKRSGRLED